MAEKRKRSQNFSIQEKDRLLKLLVLHKDMILNKKTDSCTNKAKLKSWSEITNTFNSSATVLRSKESLVKIWEKLKMESKVYYQNTRNSNIAAERGPLDINFDPILEQVCALLGRPCSGWMDGSLDIPDCDMEMLEPCGEIKLEILDEDISLAPSSSKTDPLDTDNETKQTPHGKSEKCKKAKTRKISHSNERTETSTILCNNCTSSNKDKEEIEDIKRQLLEEELLFKRKLYDLQLQAAAKEVVIKDEVLKHIKGSGIDVKLFIGMQDKN